MEGNRLRLNSGVGDPPNEHGGGEKAASSSQSTTITTSPPSLLTGQPYADIFQQHLLDFVDPPSILQLMKIRECNNTFDLSSKFCPRHGGRFVVGVVAKCAICHACSICHKVDGWESHVRVKEDQYWCSLECGLLLQQEVLGQFQQTLENYRQA